MSSTTRAARADVLIIGGGVAGLWTRMTLSQAGFTCVLVENAALGAGQTIASQGLIHRGVKYALPGAGDGGALAAVHPVWEDCFAGRRRPDLGGVPILAPRVHLWTIGDLFARGAARAAAAVMRSEVQRLERAEFPAPFAAAPRGFEVYTVHERAVDAGGLVAALAAAAGGPILCAGVSVWERPAGRGHAVALKGCDGAALRVEASHAVLAAGEGNEALLATLGLGEQAPMQRRPLHMVLAHGAPFHLHGHCIAASPTPRLTVTSAEDRGRVVWYLGGGLSESGVGRSGPEQVEFARREVAACLPWVDPGAMRWTAFRIDRAEGRTASGRRPETAVVRTLGGVSVVWPTKLALAPAAAGEVLAAVGDLERRADADVSMLAGLAAPPLAPRPWQREDLSWT